MFPQSTVLCQLQFFYKFNGIAQFGEFYEFTGFPVECFFQQKLCRFDRVFFFGFISSKRLYGTGVYFGWRFLLCAVQ